MSPAKILKGNLQSSSRRWDLTGFPPHSQDCTSHLIFASISQKDETPTPSPVLTTNLSVKIPLSTVPQILWTFGSHMVFLEFGLSQAAKLSLGRKSCLPTDTAASLCSIWKFQQQPLHPSELQHPLLLWLEASLVSAFFIHPPTGTISSARSFQETFSSSLQPVGPGARIW